MSFPIVLPYALPNTLHQHPALNPQPSTCPSPTIFLSDQMFPSKGIYSMKRTFMAWSLVSATKSPISCSFTPRMTTTLICTTVYMHLIVQFVENKQTALHLLRVPSVLHTVKIVSVFNISSAVTKLLHLPCHCGCSLKKPYRSHY